jgi:hypothetical protein
MNTQISLLSIPKPIKNDKTKGFSEQHPENPLVLKYENMKYEI